jgi:tRNA pseudouridine32 synthase/23S rRNA pseudouridine746 synthase
MTAEEMLARLLYRDGLMLVVDKPAGYAVHRGPKGGEALEDYFGALRFGLPRAPALAHRLDRDTSGPDADAGRIGIPLSKRDESRGWWMKADPHGMPSVTTWQVMGRAALADASAAPAATPLPNPPAQGGREQTAERGTSTHYTWLALAPLTGRTHQLRVHCAEMGFPIVGDAIYGSAPRLGGPPLHLHAREITVPISKNKPPVTVTAPVPAHMRELLNACGWREGT